MTTNSLAQLFAYPARTAILESLYYQPGEQSLRLLARIAGLQVRSAQLALKDLQGARLVQRRASTSRVYFRLNRRHSAYALLAAVFQAVQEARIRARNTTCRTEGRAVMQFVSSALRLSECARGSRHEELFQPFQGS
jgi:DNA-binding transcriptional ArsR family regulator